MLTTYLDRFISKFIIVEDDLEEPGDKLFNSILKQAFSSTPIIIYLQFSFNLQRISAIGSNTNKIANLYNFTKLATPDACAQCKSLLKNVQEDSILIIDSLAHMFYKLGGKQAYKTLGNAVKLPALKQILTILHCDLLLENEEIIQHFTSLASLHIKIERQFGQARRLSYLYRKGRGKVIRDTEEFCITDDKVITRPITKLEVKTLLQKDNLNINSLTTFNIELNDKDKENRSQLDLPFLPKDLQTKDTTQGEIHYVFDAGDDWDADDPDDDLDI